MATHPPSYLKAIVIAHGKSEKKHWRLCKIKSQTQT